LHGTGEPAAALIRGNYSGRWRATPPICVPKPPPHSAVVDAAPRAALSAWKPQPCPSSAISTASVHGPPAFRGGGGRTRPLGQHGRPPRPLSPLGPSLLRPRRTRLGAPTSNLPLIAAVGGSAILGRVRDDAERAVVLLASIDPAPGTYPHHGGSQYAGAGAFRRALSGGRGVQALIARGEDSCTGAGGRVIRHTCPQRTLASAAGAGQASGDTEYGHRRRVARCSPADARSGYVGTRPISLRLPGRGGPGSVTALAPLWVGPPANEPFLRSRRSAYLPPMAPRLGARPRGNSAGTRPSRERSLLGRGRATPRSFCSYGRAPSRIPVLTAGVPPTSK